MRDADSTGRYDVQLTGELLPGYDLDAAVAAIAALYRTDRAHVAGLLAAAPCVCKSNVTRPRAGQHVRALKRAGAVAVVVPRPAKSTATHADPATPLPASTCSAPVPRVLPSGSAGDAAAATPDPGDTTDCDDADAREDSPLAAPEATAGWDADTRSPRRSPGAWRWVALGMVIGFALGLGSSWLLVTRVTPGTDARLAAQPPAAAAAKPEPQPAGVARAADDLDAAEPEPRSAQASPAAAGVDAAGTGMDTPPAGEPDAPAGPAAQRVAVPAGTGPFGLEQGMALADLDIAGDAPGPGRRLLASVPEPMALIERVHAIAAPGTGLCGIEAQSRSIETAADGAALRAAFERMAAEVERRYGALERTDIRLSRAADAAGTSWMQRLRAGQKRLMSIWAAPNASTRVEGLTRITLTATALDDDHGLIRIAYHFFSYPACMAELAAGADSD